MTQERYDPEYLKEINQKVDLLGYASTHFDFEKRGGNYFTHCPSTSHNDITPSLCINPERNMFKCFACGAGGGIINWLRFTENLSFENAVKKAANLAGVKQFSDGYKSQTVIINRLLAPKKNKTVKHDVLNSDIYSKFSKELPREWLEEGISPEAMNRYHVRIDNDGNRIVYPVFDVNGNFINVKGRTRQKFYKELGIAKYINYYKVGMNDYFQGWQQALPSIIDTNEIILFEGIKSCMKAFDYGYLNTVSVECHEINIEQIKLLIKLGADVVIAFDSDIDPTSIKGIDILKKFLNVYIIYNTKLLGEKESPVDKGKDVWEKLYMERYLL